MGLKAARRAGGDDLASPPGPIRPGDPFAVAGRKAIWPHLGRLLEIEGDLGDPARTDALRRYRVATRRLRVALRIFRDAYPKGETKAIRRRLSELAEALGSVRDLDVRIQEIDHWAMDRGATDADAIRPLREALESRRAAALGELLAEIRRPAHARLMTALIAFVTATEPGAFGHPGAPGWRTADRAGSRIWEAFERVRSYAPAVREADLPTLHALRVDAKRLRYAVEFLGDVLGPGRRNDKH